MSSTQNIVDYSEVITSTKWARAIAKRHQAKYTAKVRRFRSIKAVQKSTKKGRDEGRVSKMEN